jgi:ubiquinone biosynthesis protein COQ4
MVNKFRLPKMDFLSVFKGTISLFRNPNNTIAVYDIEDGLRGSRAMHLAVAHAKSEPAIAQLIQERFVAPSPNLDTLLQYPPESLGYCYAHSLTEAGFDPNFYRAIAIEDDASYLLMRLRQTHDIWHLITGFGTDVAGELGLKAFELAQTRRPMAVILLVGGLLKTLTESPEALPYLLDQIVKGYQLGRQTQPLLAQKWETQWEKPLTQWQQELGILSVHRAIAP